ncbi:MAG: hypothetical protein K2L34_06285 [Muribaculaceae bacterium]|nr:hypothetical protein [Muribaculaceae bacterium]
MDDIKSSLERIRAQFVEAEKINMASINVGDIIYVSLDEEDGLILNKGYTTRKKFIVIIGFTPEGIAVGALLINSRLTPSKRSREMMDSQYLLLRRNYPSILDYDSWLDCSDIFELSKDKISERNARLKGSLIEDDKERVFNILRETDMIDNITKRRFGII